jgi:hypothetical protein
MNLINLSKYQGYLPLEGKLNRLKDSTHSPSSFHNMFPSLTSEIFLVIKCYAALSTRRMLCGFIELNVSNLTSTTGK